MAYSEKNLRTEVKEVDTMSLMEGTESKKFSYGAGKSSLEDNDGGLGPSDMGEKGKVEKQ